MAASKMKTRAKGSVKESNGATTSTTPKVSLQPMAANPPKLFILPKDISAEARIVTLQNPRLSIESRYLCCPDKGFFEFKKFSAPKTTPRSWLLAPAEETTTKTPSEVSEQKDESDFGASKGYVTKSADLNVATPIDPLFLILPALAPVTSKKSDPPKRLFLSCEDYFDSMYTTSPHLRTMLQSIPLREVMETRMAAVCDTAEAGDEVMYRLNESMLLNLLLQKATQMVKHGLPVSMEEKLVRKALEIPMLSLKRGESSLLELAEEEDTGLLTPAATEDSQTTTSSIEELSQPSEGVSASNSFSSQATPAPKPIEAPEGIPHLLRIRTALNFITTTYLPPHLSAIILSQLSLDSSTTTSHIDFSPLEAHLSHLAQLRQEALASRSLSDFSRKRSMNEDEEAGEGRAEKKRKLEEEEKRKKAGESRGVKNLKKVNVSGMKKMSDFFKKK